MQAFRIRNGHEWATIALQGWRTELGHEQGEILVHSSFGNWAHQWSSMGMPLKRFLISIKRDSLAGKLLGSRTREFDFEASRQCWRRHLVAARRQRLLSEVDMSDAWDEFRSDAPCSMDLFLDRIRRTNPGGNHELWRDIEHYVVHRNNQQFDAFWLEIWPLFLQQLRLEDVAANEPEAAMA